jgi:hypothetical protein
MEWKHLGSPAKEKFMKGEANWFLDSKGPILEDYLEKGNTINSARYSDLLDNNLKPAFHTKSQGLLSKKVLLHDNALPNMASQTVETSNHLGFQVLVHPAYNPGLASYDYLFGPLKNALRGGRISTDKEVKEGVHKWLRDQQKNFFLEEIRKLVDRWTKCIKKEGDYIEK